MWFLFVFSHFFTLIRVSRAWMLACDVFGVVYTYAPRGFASHVPWVCKRRLVCVCVFFCMCVGSSTCNASSVVLLSQVSTHDASFERSPMRYVFIRNFCFVCVCVYSMIVYVCVSVRAVIAAR